MRGNKQKYVVWFVLHDGNAATIFLYIGKKSPSILASPIRRQNSYVPSASCHIIQFSSNAKKLHISTRNPKRISKIASNVVNKSLESENIEQQVAYDYEIELSEKEKVDSFIGLLRKEENISIIKLNNITFSPNPSTSDFEMTITKRRSLVDSEFKKQEKLYSTKINSSNTHELTVLYDKRPFKIRIVPIEDDKFQVSYIKIGRGSHMLNKQFEKHMEEQGILISKQAQ